MGIRLFKKVKDGRALDGILDVCPWWLLFAGLACGALGATWWIAIAGAASLILTQGRAKPTIAGKIVGGLASLYDITAYFGDVLSYSRVMALMLAGGVIASVFNTVGAMTGNIVTFFIIFVIGHLLNLGLNLLGCFVHDLRLQCLEFFGKFYQDGGRPFKPLSVKTKYNTLVKK
jgi:V/A-type H+-transporting ATPase subunit I